MRTPAAVLVLAMCVVAARAQQDPEKTFRTAVEHKTLLLRDFNGGDHDRWHWDGTALVPEAPRFRQFVGIQVSKVRVNAVHATLEGPRVALQTDDSGNPTLVKDGTKIVVDVDFGGAERNSLLPEIAGQVFFADLGAATAALPCVHARAIGRSKRGPALPAWIHANCTSAGNAASGGSHAQVDTPGPTYRPPRAIYTPVPEFSEEARQRKFSGIVQIGLEVDATGIPRDLWVVRSVGLGLDEKAVDAVSRYQFAPATRDGRPVAVNLYVDVNFQIF